MPRAGGRRPLAQRVWELLRPAVHSINECVNTIESTFLALLEDSGNVFSAGISGRARGCNLCTAWCTKNGTAVWLHGRAAHRDPRAGDSISPLNTRTFLHEVWRTLHASVLHASRLGCVLSGSPVYPFVVDCAGPACVAMCHLRGHKEKNIRRVLYRDMLPRNARRIPQLNSKSARLDVCTNSALMAGFGGKPRSIIRGRTSTHASLLAGVAATPRKVILPVPRNTYNSARAFHGLRKGCLHDSPCWYSQVVAM